ncbi:hypothetical protein H2201_000316 [Coniosporium apollinis]|uniref:C2H2-type domain-containing protein n=1 Tax=Coniosporium apollinis TaxID=61459 RepID=A0ABQ9P4C4_9PEZI|nr:hypothetical protein H2201_000316 [Coniosporium apollinis]
MADLASVSPLNNIPQDIQIHRERIFALETPVQMTPAVFDKYWPYMDNVWCTQQYNKLSEADGHYRIEKRYGVCRLYRQWKLGEAPEGSRRKRREMATCKSRFRITTYADGMKVIERIGPPHSHDLEHVDQMKRNTAVRNIVLSDFFTNWEANAILAYLKDTTQLSGGRDMLREAGGRHINRQEVSNIKVGALKKAYPGQDISEVRKQMDKYKNLHVCSWKGCEVPPFETLRELLDHRKEMHGNLTHDHSHKHYVCPEKTCWRHKKSKGFSTFEGLNDHLRKHHGSAVTPEQVVALSLYKATVDEPMPDLTPRADPMTPAMSTPRSDGPSPQIEQALSTLSNGNTNGASTANQAADGIQVLPEAQRTSMTQRLASLEQQRARLDQEIESLRHTLHAPVAAQYHNGAGYTSPYVPAPTVDYETPGRF